MAYLYEYGGIMMPTYIPMPDRIVKECSKGSSDSRTFVEATLNYFGISYKSALKLVDTQDGMIGALKNDTGEIISVDPTGFDAENLTYL